MRDILGLRDALLQRCNSTWTVSARFQSEPALVNGPKRTQVFCLSASDVHQWSSYAILNKDGFGKASSGVRVCDYLGREEEQEPCLYRKNLRFR